MTRHRKNPTIGMHPDLFGGETRMVRAAEGMSRAQLVQLPRDAFTDAEWDSLDEDVQEEIYENDDASKDRVDGLIDEFVKRHEYLRGGMDQWQHDSIQEDFDQELAYLSHEDLFRRAEEHASSRWWDSLFEDLGAEGFSKDQIETALVEALQDNNNYEYTWDTSEYGHAFLKGSYTDSFHIDDTDLNKLLEGMHDDEIDRALYEINRKTDLSLKVKDLKEAAAKYGLEVDGYATWYGDADPDWDRVRRAVEVTLNDQEPAAEYEQEQHKLPPEERIIHTYPDGFFVLDLTPDELPEEGKTMGMCVGRSDMGYIKAVRAGNTKILSLRRPSGKPLFTLEVIVDRYKPGGVAEIAQIKGKANRLPGWDLGKEGQGQLKLDEVKKAIELVESLGVDPEDVRDLRPALAALQGKRQNPRRPAYRTFDDPALGA